MVDGAVMLPFRKSHCHFTVLVTDTAQQVFFIWWSFYLALMDADIFHRISSILSLSEL